MKAEGIKTEALDGELAGEGPTSRRWTVFAMCSALFALSQFYRVSNAIIAPELQLDLSLSHDSLGLLSATFFYAFAVTQVPLALYLDHLGARQIMAFLTLVAAVGACLFATAQDLRMALIGRALLGLGMAGNLMGAMKLFTEWFSPREFATLSGLTVAIGTFGNVAGSTPLAMLVTWTGWRWAFILIAALTAALALLFYMTVRPGPYCCMRPMNGRQELELRRKVGYLFRRRDYWLISCGTFFRYGTLMAIQALWAGPYLIEHLRIPVVTAGNIIMISNIGYIVGCPLGGFLSDRVLSSRKVVVVIGMAGMALALCSLTVGWGESRPTILVLTFFLLGVFAGFGNTMYAHIKGVMPADMTGMALAGINLFTMLGAGVYIHAMGWVMDHVAGGARGYQAAFGLALAGVVLAGVLYLWTRESSEWKCKDGEPRMDANSLE